MTGTGWLLDWPACHLRTAHQTCKGGVLQEMVECEQGKNMERAVVHHPDKGLVLQEMAEHKQMNINECQEALYHLDKGVGPDKVRVVQEMVEREQRKNKEREAEKAEKAKAASNASSSESGSDSKPEAKPADVKA